MVPGDALSARADLSPRSPDGDVTPTIGTLLHWAIRFDGNYCHILRHHVRHGFWWYMPRRFGDSAVRPVFPYRRMGCGLHWHGDTVVCLTFPNRRDLRGLRWYGDSAVRPAFPYRCFWCGFRRFGNSRVCLAPPNRRISVRFHRYGNTARLAVSSYRCIRCCLRWFGDTAIRPVFPY